MKSLYNLKDKLCEELEQIACKSTLSTGDLETAHKLTDTIKNIDKIEMLESDDGYSRDGGWEARGTYGRRYDNGHAYGRHHYVRAHYSREDGRERMSDELERLMHTGDDREREIIRRALDEIRRD